MPAATLEGHLAFALKHEGLDLAFLKRLFAAAGLDTIADLVGNKRTGSCARRVWFLYEWLSGRKLDLPTSLIRKSLERNNVSLGSCALANKPACHVANGHQQTFHRAFMVLRQTAATQPAKSPLDHPASWDHHNALLAARCPDNLQQIVNAVRKQGVAQLRPMATLRGSSCQPASPKLRPPSSSPRDGGSRTSKQSDAGRPSAPTPSTAAQVRPASRTVPCRDSRQRQGNVELGGLTRPITTMRVPVRQPMQQPVSWAIVGWLRYILVRTAETAYVCPRHAVLHKNGPTIPS